MVPDWSSLSYDLTELIFEKVPAVSDLVSCRKVCRSWCYVSHSCIISNLPIKSPVLVLPKHYLPSHLSETSSSFPVTVKPHHQFPRLGSEPTHYCFFNPVACELYPLTEKSKELLKLRVFIGSSNGWALFKGLRDLIMFNACTGTAIRSPVSPPNAAIKNTLVLVDPVLDKIKNSHPMLVGLSDNSFLDISPSPWGDTRFRLTIPTMCPRDAICFDGLVYGVLIEGYLVAYDFSEIDESNPNKVVVLKNFYPPSFNPGKKLSYNHQLHLVDSSGELWLVSKLGFKTYSQIGVYKFDFNARKWVDMDSFGDLVVILCKNQSIAFSPLGPSQYKRNCVYFEDEHRLQESEYRILPPAGPCMFVYDLEDGSITSFVNVLR